MALSKASWRSFLTPNKKQGSDYPTANVKFGISGPPPGALSVSEHLGYEKKNGKVSNQSLLHRLASKWINRKVASQQAKAFVKNKALPRPDIRPDGEKKKNNAFQFGSPEPRTKSETLQDAGSPQCKQGSNLNTKLNPSAKNETPSSKNRGKWRKVKTWLGSGAVSAAGFGSATPPSNASVKKTFLSKIKLKRNHGSGGGGDGGGGIGGDGGSSGGGGGGGPGGTNRRHQLPTDSDDDETRILRSNPPFAFIGSSVPRPSPRTPGHTSLTETLNALSSHSDEEYVDGEDGAESDSTGSASEDDLVDEEEEYEDAQEYLQPPTDRNEQSSNQDRASQAIDMLRVWMNGVFQSISNFNPLESIRGKKSEYSEEMERQAILAETAQLVLNLIDQRGGEDAFAQRSEIGVLRRLQREAFSELLKLRERAEKLEIFSGLRRTMENSSGDGDLLLEPHGTRLTGQVSASAALIGAEGEEAQVARAAMERAGMRSGLTTKFRFETLCRNSDLLLTDCVSGLGETSSSVMLGGPITLQKVLYIASIVEGIVLKLSPMGARGWDMAESLNPIQGEGLTQFSSGGAPLLGNAHGSGVGISFSGNSASFSASQFLSGWGVTPDSDPENAGLCASSLLQLTLQPHDRVKLSFSGLHRKWPAPPPPSSTSHWSEMGPLVIPRIHLWSPPPPPTDDAEISSPGSMGNDSTGESRNLWNVGSTNNNAGTSLQSLSVSGSVELPESVTLSGWAQADNADWLDDDEVNNMQWAVALSRRSLKGGRRLGWGVCVGSGLPSLAQSLSPPQSPLDDNGAASHDKRYEPFMQPMQAEAFLEVGCGPNLKLQPGVVRSFDGRKAYSTFMLRASWNL